MFTHSISFSKSGKKKVYLKSGGIGTMIHCHSAKTAQELSSAMNKIFDLTDCIVTKNCEFYNRQDSYVCLRVHS